jgi:predicted dehydrogenase
MRFGLIGTGYWAREVHGAALAAHPTVELVGIWGRSKAKAKALADSLGVAAFDDVDDLFEQVDAVAFAVPPAVQAELATRAAAKGCHLLMDKPVALDVAAAQRLADAVDEAGVRSIVFFTFRFVPEVAEWLDRERAADEWLSACVRMHASIFEPGNPFGDSPWRRQYGPLWDVGPHALSLVLPLLGPVERVVADGGAEEGVDVLLHHRGGGTSTLSLSITAPLGSRGTEMRFFGSISQTALPVWTSTTQEAMAACITALTDDRADRLRHPCDVHFGNEVVSVLQAVQEFLGRDPLIRTTTVLA